MPIDNQQSSIVNRKGIYQSFNAEGYVTGDERWRIMRTLDGGVRIDTDTTRMAPFPESRNESFGLELASDLTHRRLAIHARDGRREARADFAPGRASLCWRLDETSHTRDYDWSSDCEIGYNSPLFAMVILWRHPLTAGQSTELSVAQLDHLTFEPAWECIILSCAGDEQHETRFGLLNLVHYTMDRGGDRSHKIDLWCDSGRVIFDLMSPNDNGAMSGFRLVAVNFPS